MIFSKRSVTTVGLCVLVVCMLTVKIDSAVPTPVRIQYPAVKYLQLRTRIPASLAKRNRLRFLHPEEALLVLETRPGIHGTWYRVVSLKKGDRGWVAGWLVTPAKVTIFSVRPERHRLVTHLYHSGSAWIESHYGYVFAWIWKCIDEIIATIAAVSFFRAWRRWRRRRRRAAAV